MISVPACFNEAQREAIKYAGDIAGLDIQGVVEDPVAAALAYGLDKRDGLFAVYSFGGTFEFSILEISNGVIKVYIYIFNMKYSFLLLTTNSYLYLSFVGESKKKILKSWRVGLRFVIGAAFMEGIYALSCI